MTSNTIQTESAATLAPRSARSFRKVFLRDAHYPMLLAIRDDDIAVSAIGFTSALARRGANPSVVEVSQPMAPVGASPNAMLYLSSIVLGGDEYRAERRTQLRTMIASASGRDQGWQINSMFGNPANCIIDEAERTNAQLIVLGNHQHGAMEQALGENTVTRVISKSPVPVIGLTRSLSALPKRIMVAVDFGCASEEAAHLAANLADPGGTVVLVHVQLPYPIVDHGDEGAALVQREGVHAAFERLSAEISVGRKIRIEKIAKSGDPSTALLTVARAVAPDLIAIARQRHHFLTKLMLGSTSRRLLRTARWPMLVTPPCRTAQGALMLRLEEIMTRDLISATPDMSLQDATEILAERHIGALPVVEAGLVVGLFSATDLLSYIAELCDATPSISFRQRRKLNADLEDATVGDLMTRKVHSLPPDANIDEAAWLMSEKRIHRILVMDGDAPIGIVSALDVAKAVADHRMKARTYVFS